VKSVKINGRINEIPREHVGGEHRVSGEAPNPPPRKEVPFYFVPCGWEKRKGGDAVYLCGRKKG
jgi:hypothetical protein